MRKLKILVLLAMLGGGGIVAFALWVPNIYTEDRYVTVSRGQSFPEILDSLDRNGIIANRLLFQIAAKILGGTDRIQIGRYWFKSGMSNSEILEDLKHGTSAQWIGVTVPEGFTAAQVATRLTKSLGIDSARFLSIVGDTALARANGSTHGTLEGFLMPSTYRFHWQTDEQEIVQAMLDEFWKFWDGTVMQAASDRRMTISQVLAMASIVEWETNLDEERPIVAGVYYNRLSKGMLLEADPTVQYLLNGGKRLLKYSDLKIVSPYNTYRNKGLPPGPVNNPGQKSILAALYPEKHPYLFFVANGKGGHTFSKNYQQHLQAVKTYRRARDLRRIPGDAPKNTRIN